MNMWKAVTVSVCVVATTSLIGFALWLFLSPIVLWTVAVVLLVVRMILQASASDDTEAR